MLIKLTIWAMALTRILSANSLLAEDNRELIIQTTKDMDVKKVEAFFDDHPDADQIIWAPLERNITRLSLNIPRGGFERALEFKDGNSLFHLSSINDLCLRFHVSDMVSIGLNLASDGYLIEAHRDLSEGLAAGLSVEHLDKFKFGGFFNKSLSYNNIMFSTTVGYDTNATGYIGGEAVQLSSDEGSELFSRMNFSRENDYSNLGFGKTWFDVQFDLDQTLIAQWDNKGWTGGFLFSKAQSGTKFTLGLVDIDQDFKPKVYADFSIPLEKLRNFSSKILLRSGGLRSQYLPQKSLKSFRREELSRQWRDAMDFSSKN
jgi:hypothetical protein